MCNCESNGRKKRHKEPKVARPAKAATTSGEKSQQIGINWNRLLHIRSDGRLWQKQCALTFCLAFVLIWFHIRRMWSALQRPCSTRNVVWSEHRFPELQKKFNSHLETIATRKSAMGDAMDDEISAKILDFCARQQTEAMNWNKWTHDFMSTCD